MKLFALTLLVVANLIANQAFAGDIPTQPLARADCDKAAMAWDENANVCSESSKEAGSQTASEAAAEVGVSSQPLTRLECDKAGLVWADNANVCGVADSTRVFGGVRIGIRKGGDHARVRGDGYFKAATNEKRMRCAPEAPRLFGGS